MNTLNVEQASKLLHIHPITLKEKARSGEIPGAKIGRRWVFLEVDLLEHIRTQYALRVMQGEQKEKSVCHSTNAKTRPSGGSKSGTTDRRYKEALGLTTS